MVNTRSFVLGRLANVRMDLEEVLGRIDDGMMAWAPAEGMRTVSGQLVEIAGTEIQTLTSLRKQPWVTDDAVRERIGNLGSVDTLHAFLGFVRSDTLSYVEGLSDEDLNGDAGFAAGWDTYGLPWIPRAEILRSLAQHEYYHVGQLTSYIWAAGDDPYKWHLGLPKGR